MIHWAGRDWKIRDLPPSAASTVYRLAGTDEDRAEAVTQLVELAGIPLENIVMLAYVDPDYAGEADTADLVQAILESTSGRPWGATIALCKTVVTQWSTIRGRLIDKGIPDPLRSLPSLTALLDAVEIMILDSMEKEEDRDKYLRDMYHQTTTDKNTPPPGWEDGAQLDGLFG